MFPIHSLRPFAAGLSVLFLVGLGGLAHAQVTQRYDAWSDEIPVSVLNNQGTLVDLKYRHRTYTATDVDGQIIRQDRLWYFTNAYDESRGLTATCNRWVYWLKVDPQDRTRDLIWARCPTPHHPKYTEMQAELQGDELWQLIPAGSRQPKQSIHVLVEKFAPMIAASPGEQPLISEDCGVTVQLLSFSGDLFR